MSPFCPKGRERDSDLCVFLLFSTLTKKKKKLNPPCSALVLSRALPNMKRNNSKCKCYKGLWLRVSDRLC